MGAGSMVGILAALKEALAWANQHAGILFLAGLAPQAHRAALPSDTLIGLYDLASDLLRANLGSGPRVTRRESDGRGGLWVYGRGGQACLRCGGLVRRDRLGVNPRPTYWCSGCQTGP